MKGLKFAIVLAFIASAASLAGNWFLFQRFKAEKTARGALETKQVQLEESNTSLQSQVAQIDQYEQELERLRTQVKDQVNQRDTLKKELDGAYGEISTLKKQIKDLESEKQTLTNQLNEGQVTESAIVHEAARVATLPGAAAVPIVPQTEQPPAQPKESKVRDETKKAEAPKQKAAPAEPVPDQRPLQVLSVNRQFKFVVINMGLRGNVKIGDVLRVEQNGKLVGRVQVEKLYENFSACNIVEEIKPAQIKEGDLVRIA